MTEEVMGSCSPAERGTPCNRLCCASTGAPWDRYSYLSACRLSVAGLNWKAQCGKSRMLRLDGGKGRETLPIRTLCTLAKTAAVLQSPKTGMSSAVISHPSSQSRERPSRASQCETEAYQRQAQRNHQSLMTVWHGAFSAYLATREILGAFCPSDHLLPAFA